MYGESDEVGNVRRVRWSGQCTASQVEWAMYGESGEVGNVRRVR